MTTNRLKPEAIASSIAAGKGRPALEESKVDSTKTHKASKRNGYEGGREDGDVIKPRPRRERGPRTTATSPEKQSGGKSTNLNKMKNSDIIDTFLAPGKMKTKEFINDARGLSPVKYKSLVHTARKYHPRDVISKLGQMI